MTPVRKRNGMNRALAFAAIAEAATGVLLVAAPSLVSRLLLGAELMGVAIVLGRVAGISLVSLGVACWPGGAAGRYPLSGMLTYGVLITTYLTYLGLRGESAGPVLWTVVVLHAVLTALLWRSWSGRP
jgi:hypothetical protein